ncbi:unnamed protein product [Albugo candida]|uniref:Uncharacterized protein n=1 Tax=Albugo candida TaxID=65357 RepID=A0A024GKP3_9STRA|nr:unnamed protein product [Albugo candida]|eukprot:CCI47338.1 unnamed protein product [Albugo candida]
MSIAPFAQPTPRGDIFQHIDRKISYYALRTARKSSISNGNRREAMLFYLSFSILFILKIEFISAKNK